MSGMLICGLQSVAAATTELWPSMVNVMGAPLRSAGSRTQSKQSKPSQRSEVAQPQAATVIQVSLIPLFLALYRLWRHCSAH
jgi:hypothetical protein